MILNKDNYINKNNNSKDNYNINKNYDFNIIVENNENEEKDDEKDILETNNILFQNKENNKINDYEKNYYNNYESLSDLPNSNISLPKNSTLDIADLKKNYNNELGKIKEKQNNKTIDNNNFNNNNIGKNLINEENRIYLHRLLRGDVNVLSTIKLINKGGEEIKVLKINNSDKKIKKNERKINLNDIKTPNRNNSSINFFSSSNPVNKLNYELFEDVIKSKENDIEDNYNYDLNIDSYDSRDNNKINNKANKVNKMNNTEFRSASSNINRTNKNKQKLHIVNLPDIIDYKNNDQKEKNNADKEVDNYNEAFNQILELRKINYENDLYRKKIGPNTNKNSRNTNIEYNNKMKVYSGINNNYYKNEISTYEDGNNIRLKKIDINK